MVHCNRAENFKEIYDYVIMVTRNNSINIILSTEKSSFFYANLDKLL